ncbi:MAG: tetratricopeptide repeat protein [Pseudomonadota bacterium]
MGETSSSDNRRPDPAPPRSRGRWEVFAIAIAPLVVLALAGLAVYANTLGHGFILDDAANILENPSIRNLFSFPGPLLPARGIPVSHRIVLNLSLAVNWAISGAAPWSYHLGNILLHILTALVLYGILARTLSLPPLAARLGDMARPVALASALVWMVHPLQTMAVAYVSQRGEVLSGLLILTTLYAAIRGLIPGAPGRAWRLGALAAFFLGITVKENMGIAPLAVLAWTWVFAGKNPLRAVREAPLLYVGFAVGFAVMLYNLNAGLPHIPYGRDNQLWFSLSWLWHQTPVLVHYLSLALWPHPLVFDYTDWLHPAFLATLPNFLFILALFSGTLAALVRQRPVGFLGAWFFLLLAPTSSFLRMVDVVVEYRMYLPLAALAAGFGAGAFLLARRALSLRGAKQAWAVVMAVAVLALGTASHLRNRDYVDRLTIWADTLEKRPTSPRAAHNFGFALLEEGRVREALPYLVQAVETESETLNERNTLAMALVELGQVGEAVRLMEPVVGRFPGNASYRNTLGFALLQAGRIPEAIRHLEAGLAGDPENRELVNNLGKALVRAGRSQEAVDLFTRAAARWPGDARVHNNLGGVLLILGREEEAARAFMAALAIRPGYSSAENGLGYAFLLLDRPLEALPHLHKAVQLDPESLPARLNLAEALLALGQPREAEIHVRAVLDRAPGNSDALALLSRVGEVAP